MIDTSKDFNKYVGSFNKALNFVKSLIGEEYLKYELTRARKTKRIVKAEGKQDKFNWSYDPDYKTLFVRYIDGRDLPQERIQPMDNFIIWIEGLSYEKGEKVKSFTEDGIEYTTKMTEALRITPEEIYLAKELLKERGIADWVVNGERTFIATSYVPKGTRFKKADLNFS